MLMHFLLTTMSMEVLVTFGDRVLAVNKALTSGMAG